MNHFRTPAAQTCVSLCTMLLTGCASVDARLDYERAGAQVRQSIGFVPLENPEAFDEADAAANALMADGLTCDDAVKLALLNNPRARSVLLQVGMARADVVQAGLLSNPIVGLSFRLPEGGGLTNIEASLAQNIADLWMIPARSHASRRDLDRVTLLAAQELVALAIDTKIAYFNAVATDDALAIARDNVSLTERLLEISDARLEAGTVGSLDVNLARGQALQSRVTLRTVRLQAASARRDLATLLGLTTLADELVLSDPLPVLSGKPLPIDRFLQIALDSRLDARAARHAVESAAARVEFELARVFPNFEIGLSMERGERRGQPGRRVLADAVRSSVANGQLTAPSIQSRGQRRLERSQRIEAILGPSLSLTLPIFDQNQAQIAKARMAYLQAKAELDALERSIIQSTRDAADRLTTAWDIARLYQNDVTPQVQETLKFSEATYQAGQTTILNVIDAQRSLLETRRASVAALQNAATAIAELERAAARPMCELMRMASTPTEITQIEFKSEGRMDANGNE